MEGCIMDIPISKITVTDDGRILIFPSTTNSIFEFVYRAAAGVYWNKELHCFSSSNPNNWDNWTYTNWYGQILSVVKDELGKRLRLTDATVFNSKSEDFEDEIRAADVEVQKWIDENII